MGYDLDFTGVVAVLVSSRELLAVESSVLESVVVDVLEQLSLHGVVVNLQKLFVPVCVCVCVCVCEPSSRLCWPRALLTHRLPDCLAVVLDLNRRYQMCVETRASLALGAHPTLVLLAETVRRLSLNSTRRESRLPSTYRSRRKAVTKAKGPFRDRHTHQADVRLRHCCT